MSEVRTRTIGTIVDGDNYDILIDSEGAAIVVAKTCCSKLKVPLDLSVPLHSDEIPGYLHQITRT